MKVNRTMSRHKVKQINNILIYWYPVYREFYTVSPDGHLLKGFKTQAAAENWCREESSELILNGEELENVKWYKERSR